MFPPLIWAVMSMGLLILVVGLVIANSAVLEMSRRLNAKYKNLRQKVWWEVIGNPAAGVIREYRAIGWKDALPEKRLRLGYQLIGAGFATIVVASVLGNYFRGSF